VIVITGAEQTDDTATDTTHKVLLKNPWPGGMLQGTVNWYNGGLCAWASASGQNMHWGEGAVLASSETETASGSFLSSFSLTDAVGTRSFCDMPRRLRCALESRKGTRPLFALPSRPPASA